MDANLARLRREYENSLSWRMTRPLRAGGRLAHRLGLRRPEDTDEQPAAQPALDSWLEHFYDDRLQALDLACAQSAGTEGYLFRGLDDDLWALLLTQQYELYPRIRELLPDMPAPELQEMWNGRSGLALASQTKSFYSKLRASYRRFGAVALSDSFVLDFGCGWGRLTRYLARDVAAGRLFGCDPVQSILEVCRSSGLSATLARSDSKPETLPFAERFDLVFAFSVFTHLSEAAHEQCLHALHRSLQPEGILILTVRPPAYADICEPLRQPVTGLGPDRGAALSSSRYLFVPHPAIRQHPQYGSAGEMDYGETIITMQYVRERWSSLFELLEVNLLLDDPHQVMLTLKRT